ncbi:MAG: methyltransferase domain-containing protein [Bacteroidota bacterium]
MEKYLDANKAMWNQRTEIHVDSEFYDVPSFIAGRSSLNAIELDILGNLKGKKLLHLQCHFGQDTLSFARMGAHATGIDISDKAIEKARTLNEKLSLDAQFVCCNVLDIDQHLSDTYDVIFTSYGTIGWIPQLTKWAQLIHQFLKPGGQFLIVEFHPVVWMLNNEMTYFQYSYFNKEMIVETEGTYTDGDEGFEAKSYSWNHPLADVFTALLEAGLTVNHFSEYDYSPYDCFEKTLAVEKGFQIKGLEGLMPMVYALGAVKLI